MRQTACARYLLWLFVGAIGFVSRIWKATTTIPSAARRGQAFGDAIRWRGQIPWGVRPRFGGRVPVILRPCARYFGERVPVFFRHVPVIFGCVPVEVVPACAR